MKFAKPLKTILKDYLFWLLAGLGVVNLVAWLNIDLWHIGAGFAGFYTLLVPGFLLLCFLVKKKLPVPLAIALSGALSIALLMASGLFINTVIPLLGNNHPLNPTIIINTFNAVVIGLLAATAKFKPTLPFEPLNLGKLSWAVMLGALCMPVLAVLGATSLNNGGTNAFTMVSLGLIGFYVPLLIVLKRRLHIAVFPTVLYMMGLSILLMTSMRGWLVTGHDVLREYHVFLLTDSADRWNIGFFRDPYNACLSITLLPTYLHSFLHIDSAYMFKFVFQFLAALPIVPIFYLAQRFASPAVSYLAAFTYISFPAFLVDMSFLNRQSIGYLFFALFLFFLLTNVYATKWRRDVLLLVLGMAMVVSHYSTTYVALSLLVLGYLLSWFLQFTLGRKKVGKISKFLRIPKLPNRTIYMRPALISLWLVFALVGFAVVWNGPVTQTSKGITKTFQQISTTLNPTKKSVATKDAGTSKYGLVGGEQATTGALFDQFVQTAITDERTPQVESNLFPLAVAQSPQYKVSAFDEPTLPETTVGSALSGVVPMKLNGLYEMMKQSYAKILQLLLLVGFAAVLFGYGFGRSLVRKVPREYAAISIAAILLLAYQVVFPNGTLEYGVLRLFQQDLMLLALPIVLGFLFVCRFLVKRMALQLLVYSAIIVVFFGVLSGFIPQVTGDGRAALPLNNSGFYYDAYYTHPQEVAEFDWVKNHANESTPIQADRFFTALKLNAYTGIVASGSRVLPETIKRNSLVLLGTTNVDAGYIVEYQDGAILYYPTPSRFLQDNKNQVYSTSTTSVYW